MASASHQGAIFSKMTLPIVPEPEVNRIAHYSCPPTNLTSASTPAGTPQPSAVRKLREAWKVIEPSMCIHPDKFATAPFPVRVFKLPVLLSIEAAPLELS